MDDDDLVFEWDQNKADEVLKDRGISFEILINIFAGPTLVRRDDRKDYGEERWICIGAIDDVEFTLVMTWRGNVRRIITAWRSNPNERRAYRKALAQAESQH
jgi:uncharacterized DUF497 family protein